MALASNKEEGIELLDRFRIGAVTIPAERIRELFCSRAAMFWGRLEPRAFAPVEASEHLQSVQDACVGRPT